MSLIYLTCMHYSEILEKWEQKRATYRLFTLHVFFFTRAPCHRRALGPSSETWFGEEHLGSS